MPKKIQLRLSPADAADSIRIKEQISANAGIKPSSVSGYRLLKKSIDARGKNILVNLSVEAFINEPFQLPQPFQSDYKDVTNALRRVIIIGAGPAGLFAALRCLEAGIKPVLIERGKDVKSRRRDLARLNKEGIINPESNYCFGEGGAGTYSDGKLYTRSNKRGSIDKILQLFVRFGAPESIVYESHPHIGTNKLPGIITAMREHIIACGGEVLFETKLTDLVVEYDRIRHIITSGQQTMTADAYILATGHSARDIFHLLQQKKLLIEAKPFALGVRIEHPQSLIDSIQYHCAIRSEFLPPASYSLVEQIHEKGVFSFCMCPGGIIAPAATAENELVVNGWSPSKRNNPFANSGMVVQITPEDAYAYLKPRKVAQDDPLLFMHFQQQIESLSFQAGGGKFAAPAQRMTDFCSGHESGTLPGSSYLPGLQSADLATVLPRFVHEALAGGFRAFGKKMKGFFTQDAVVVATESRTSSPVRIPRDSESGHHPQLKNLYPCGEGAGYAGGIVSAAMDGEKVAEWVASKWNSDNSH